MDATILRSLQQNARATFTQLGALVGLSAPAVHERVHRLEQRGVIKGYRADVDPVVLGQSVLSLVHVIPSDSCNLAAVESSLAAVEQIEVAYTVAGDETHVLVVRTRSIAELSEVLQRLRDIEGVARTRTSVVLATPIQRGPSI